MIALFTTKRERGEVFHPSCACDREKKIVQSCDCLQPRGRGGSFPPIKERKELTERKKLYTNIKGVNELQLLISRCQEYFSHLCTHTYTLVDQPQPAEGTEQIL